MHKRIRTYSSSRIPAKSEWFNGKSFPFLRSAMTSNPCNTFSVWRQSWSHAKNGRTLLYCDRCLRPPHVTAHQGLSFLHYTNSQPVHTRRSKAMRVRCTRCHWRRRLLVVIECMIIAYWPSFVHYFKCTYVWRSSADWEIEHMIVEWTQHGHGPLHWYVRSIFRIHFPSRFYFSFSFAIFIFASRTILARSTSTHNGQIVDDPFCRTHGESVACDPNASRPETSSMGRRAADFEYNMQWRMDWHLSTVIYFVISGKIRIDKGSKSNKNCGGNNVVGAR